LDSVRATFMASPFKVQNPATNVRILSGNEEGTSSWITSNYITNAFKVNQPGKEGVQAYTIVSTLGALDLGGASTQLTYVPEKGTVIPAGFSEELQLFGHNYTVYTHSYLCYGVNEVARALFAALVLQDQPSASQIEHPCLPSNYLIDQTYEEIFDSPCIRDKPAAPNTKYSFVGVGTPSKCENLVRSFLLKNNTCPYSRCSFNETFQPEIAGTFYAFSSFFWVANFLKVLDNTSNTNRVDFELATTEQCEKNWDELKNLTVPKKVKANLMYYCLQATYISTLLTTGYRFSNQMWTGITFLSQIYDTAIGWTLGYVLKESNGYPTKFPTLTISTLTFALLVALFSLLLIMSLILTIELSKARKAWREHLPSSNHYEAI
jgi:apyrase